MKIKSPMMTGIAGRVAAFGIRRWMSMMRYEAFFADQSADPINPDCEPSIFVLWHESMLIPLILRSGLDISILVSKHRDADILEAFAKASGFNCIRGSSYRGGATALKSLIQDDKHKHIVITPDGPRGPRRQFSQGAVYLASKLGRPLMPIGFAYDHAWRMNSWDQFAIPKPFTTARSVMGTPIHIPTELDREGIENYRLIAEKQLNQLNTIAESWSETQSLTAELTRPLLTGAAAKNTEAHPSEAA